MKLKEYKIEMEPTIIGQEDEEKIALLKNLGLTLLQARVYVVLSQFEQLSAEAISRATKIHRGNVYRLIKSLQSSGLVERRLTTKKDFFAAIPLREGIQLLLSCKDREYSEIQTGAKKVINCLKVQRKGALAEEHEYFHLIPKGDANLKAFVKSMEHASSSIDDIIPWKGFEKVLIGGIKEYRKTLKRGVKIRYVTNFPKNCERNSNFGAISKIIDELKKIGSFDVRSTANFPSCVFAVFDREEVCICTHSIPDPSQTPALWSTNSILISFAQTYFDLIWNNSKII
jgi:sugar-specific transcriptional regulator TrmB